MDREIIEVEAEILNLIRVWSSILISVCYCYVITKFVPKGTVRFFMFLPVLCLFLILPLKLNFINLICPISYFISWIATFKLVLLAFGNGPLSNPLLPLFNFLLISCLPIIPKKSTSQKSLSLKEETLLHSFALNFPVAMRSLLHFAKKGLFAFFLIVFMTCCKEKIPQETIIFAACLYVYISMDVIQGVITIICQILLHTELEPPFNHPYLSTSFKDFWSRRWNRVASITLRSTVFDPIFHYSSMALGHKRASVLALVGTFLVSALMHEIIFYHLCRVMRPAWGTTLFFIIQGMFLIVESILKKKIDGKRQMQLPQIVVGSLIFGFEIWTFMRLCMTELLLENDILNQGLEEYASAGAFVWNLGIDWTHFCLRFL